MKFSEFSYKRPDMERFQEDFNSLLTQFKSAQTVEEQNRVMKLINKLRSTFNTMFNIAQINYSTDTFNKDYEAEQRFFDTNEPIYKGLETSFYQALCASPFRSTLQTIWGKQLFDIAHASSEVFHPDILESLQAENKLISEYMKLIASAKIDLDGTEHNLSSLRPLEMSPNRETRRKASQARWQFFEANSQQLDHIFDQLVKLRHQMAQKLGFANFVEMGYKRMKRTDYDAKMVKGYRDQVLAVVVPIAAELRQRQAKRIGVEQLKYYDLPFNFRSGNPKPKGDPNWIIKHGKKMYEELSNETGEFFNFMLDNELMDLVTRKGKASGGYCTYISGYDAPFIFSNFNGTSDDINVLTHEAGHAFQVYMSRSFEVPEYYWPTYEACEIHSMSMEFLAWPWMGQFFQEDEAKFKFEHLSDAVIFLPYGVSVDEFQHFVYENPEATPDERKTAWRKIEQKYLPWVDYEDNEFLNRGGFWQKQGHIFASPFYYIDYTLAQICAFQFWDKSEQNLSGAFDDYLRLCKAGGSQSFLNLVKYANLSSPFEQGCLETVVQPVKTYLEAVNDMSL